MTLSKKEQEYLRGYAQALQDMMYKLTGENTCAKHYDPIDFDETYIHSYAFDMKDGGRHHPLSDYRDMEEVKEWMLKEAVEWCTPEPEYCECEKFEMSTLPGFDTCRFCGKPEKQEGGK